LKLQRHSYIDYLHFLCMGSDSMCFLHGHVIILLLSTTVNWYILYIIFVLGLIVKQIMLLTAMTVLVYFLLLELFLYMCINPLWTCFSWVFFFFRASLPQLWRKEGFILLMSAQFTSTRILLLTLKWTLNQTLVTWDTQIYAFLPCSL